jgi:outer membrane protein assembly factor BamB
MPTCSASWATPPCDNRIRLFITFKNNRKVTLLLRTLLRASLVLALGAALNATARADLFVSSFSQNTVLRYNETTGAFLGTFISAGSGGLSAPHRGAFGPDGNFYVASADNDRVLRYNGATGAFLGIFAAAPQLDYPVDLQWGADGSLYVSSQLNNSIVRFNGTTGAFIDVFVASGSGGLDGPSGMQFHNGDLYVAGRFSSEVYRYNGTTGAFEQSFGAGNLSSAFGLDFAPDGSLLVASGGTDAVTRFDPDTGASMGNLVTGGSGGLSFPIGVEFGPDNNLYVASFNTDSVKRYDSTTGAWLGDFVVAGSGGLSNPNFMTFASLSVPEPSSLYLLLGAAVILIPARRHGKRPVRKS